MSKDGGPAFPVLSEWMRDGDGTFVGLRGAQTGQNQGWCSGMSLRDYIAANYRHSADDLAYAGSHEGMFMQVKAVLAVNYADALIELLRREEK